MSHRRFQFRGLAVHRRKDPAAFHDPSARRAPLSYSPEARRILLYQPHSLPLSLVAEIDCARYGSRQTPRGPYATRLSARTAKTSETTENAANAVASSASVVGSPVPSRLKRKRSTCQVIGLSMARVRNHAGSPSSG